MRGNVRDAKTRYGATGEVTKKIRLLNVRPDSGGFRPLAELQSVRAAAQSKLFYRFNAPLSWRVTGPRKGIAVEIEHVRFMLDALLEKESIERDPISRQATRFQ